MKTTIQKSALVAALLTLVLSCANSWAEVGGKALLTDAPSRVKPGNLILCSLSGGEKKFETLVTGNVVDGRFSPDGKQIVYGVDHMIKIMNLESRVSQDIGPYTAEFTYFNWSLDNKIYWADGPKDNVREIFSIDIKTKEKKSAHKGFEDRCTVSLDGTKAAWVMPPRCAVLGGKQYQYMGGCGGSISPSGKFLTSNLTTSHVLIGIFSFDDNGPSEKPIAYVSALRDHAINGFFFGRTDEWVCYTVEEPAKISPIAYICYWRTNDHIEIGPKYCIKDFFDETDVLPANAELEKITVCGEGPVNTPLTNEVINAGATRTLKVVGHYSAKGIHYTPQLRDGITWKVDASKLATTSTSFKGVSESGPLTVTATFKGKTYSFSASVLPALTGDGFKAEYFSDTTYTKNALTRVDPYIDYRWDGHSSIPDPAFTRRDPWSVRWSGMLDVQVDGEYTFYFMQGEGNDRFIKGEGSEKSSIYSVWVDDKLTISHAGTWNYPWAKPKASAPIVLKKGMHTIKAMTVVSSDQPVVAQLQWSGPGIRQSLLGSSYVHSNCGPLGRNQVDTASVKTIDPSKK
jgi:hypothetical protein